MKRFLGLTVLIFGLSVPAHAQAKAVGGMTGGAGGGMFQGGGGAMGGVESTPTFRTLPVVPAASLPSSYVSGTNFDFEPSTFLPYSQAIAVGQAILDETHKSVAEVAAENSREHRMRAKTAIIENAAGDVVITQE
ncbi:MAG TPA: hypothetical protein VMD78_12820 [Candidatus Baltobacteraceae bacterium]|nr:hypothetical protein [Candidatus Baltobacteraceae bacterium]